MSVGKILAVIFGALLLMVAAAVFVGGLVIVNADQDADDFFVSDANLLETGSYAIVVDSVVVDEGPTWFFSWLTDVLDVRIAATSSAGDDLFMGMADSTDVEAYLAGVAYDEVITLEVDPVEVDYRSHAGAAELAVPGEQGFWVVSTEGAGTQTLDWVIESGTWSFLLANADAGSGVSADVVFGVKVANTTTVMWVGFGIGLLLALIGLALLIAGLRSPREQQFSPPPVDTADKQEHVTRT
jgi:hypothetical protein